MEGGRDGRGFCQTYRPGDGRETPSIWRLRSQTDPEDCFKALPVFEFVEIEDPDVQDDSFHAVDPLVISNEVHGRNVPSEDVGAEAGSDDAAVGKAQRARAIAGGGE